MEDDLEENNDSVDVNNDNENNLENNDSNEDGEHDIENSDELVDEDMDRILEVNKDNEEQVYMANNDTENIRQKIRKATIIWEKIIEKASNANND